MSDETSLLSAAPDTDADAEEIVAKPAEVQEGDGKEVEAEAKAEGEPKGEEKKPEGAPEAYADFEVPEGLAIDKEVLTSFTDLAKEIGLTQEAAQKLVSFRAAQELKAVEKMASAYKERIGSWADATKNDKELGGEKMPENLAVAKKAMIAFASDGLKELMEHPSEKNPNGLGLGNHPEIIRLFHRVGKAISDDKMLTGNPARTKSTAELLYPTMSKE